MARKQVAPIAPYEAFGHIDYQRIGIIGIDELYKLFTSNDFVLNDQQIGQLLHGLKRRCYR